MSGRAEALDLQPRPDRAAAEDLEVPVLEIPRGFEVGEVVVLSLLSRGNTAVQVARLLGPEFDLGKSDVNMYRESVMDKLGTKSMAQAVHRAIKREVIPVESKPDPAILEDLRSRDRRILSLYARGVSNSRLAHASEQPLKAMNTYHDRLLERLGAWSRPHAIRRGHELGLLK